MSFDVNYRPSLWRNPGEALDFVRRTVPLAHVLKVNEGELTLLTGQELDLARADWQEQVLAAAATLLDFGPTLIIVTLGPQRRASTARRRPAATFPASRSRQSTPPAAAMRSSPALLWQLVRERRRHHGRRPTAPRPAGDDLLPEHSALRQCRRSAHCHQARGDPRPADCSGGRGVPPRDNPEPEVCYDNCNRLTPLACWTRRG